MKLSLPGATPAEGSRLADLITAGLAAAGTLPQFGDIPNLSLTVSTQPHAAPERLARDIVAQILRAMDRTG